ncbi:hypothetical protein HCY66_11415 [Acinetobacter radioresistens]|uniref:phage tail-collar fiber domain-containing protein n=1 Tax=Acinetobacter radioresistens TaxID=40216 RepID=UPI0020040C97|nr:phage tail protein [Acinetobacter radioresistens]MCK4090674.1 hypothetical protein [Acinetobacter radioresistens]
MSQPINFIITNVGKNSLSDAQKLGIKLSLNKVAIGSGQYEPKADRVALAAKFTENGISAGGLETDSFTLRFTLIMNYTTEKPVSEIGLYTTSGVLFAVASSPSESFFKLYPGIDYVANFGLSLVHTTDLNGIELVLDGRAGQAAALIQAHLTEVDPHPQYKEFSAQLIKEHIEAADPHPQYALKTFLNEEGRKLDAKIGSLLNVTDYLFPPILEGGYGNSSTLVASRKRGANYSWLNRSIIYLFCPEGLHEGWSTKREATNIATNVFQRSGTDRISSSGRNNYIVIDTERVLLNQGFTTKTNQLANEIKSGVFETGEKLVIQREAWETLAYDSDNLVVLITPEGQHEGWSITRAANQIDLNIFERSGTNRVAYTGRVNWSIYKANSAPLPIDKYPFQLISGVSKTGIFTIPAPADHDFSDPAYIPMITPESQHEGWSIKRTAAGFEVQIFNRSGTSSMAYTGKVSWAIFKLTKTIKRTVLAPGQHSYLFKAGMDYRITIVGGGGGGGNAIYYHSGATDNPSENGGNSKINANGFVVTAEGGKGGTRGCWNNGSAYRDGVSGKGGIFSYSNQFIGITGIKAEYEDGKPGKMDQYNVGEGGTALYGGEYSKGMGGKGKSGSGHRDLGYGGSGGGAASGIVLFSVREDVQASITVGAGGKYYDDPTEFYQKNYHFGYGVVGQDGIVIIEEI